MHGLDRFHAARLNTGAPAPGCLMAHAHLYTKRNINNSIINTAHHHTRFQLSLLNSLLRNIPTTPPILGVSTRHEHMASTAPTTPAPGISTDYALTATASDIEARQVNAMSKTMSAHANPFMDPAAEQEAAGDEAQFSVDSTLAVGKSASLTLGTDSLIVLGMSHGAETRGKKERRKLTVAQTRISTTPKQADAAPCFQAVCSPRSPGSENPRQHKSTKLIGRS